ncbi:hypothetical protein [Oricola thermophila]|uniref:YadA-like family protein n=1 Tax=Oricola thermophila TaxID=2742145 RepID=A0A6N1VFK7_9HYPH|nr:hypothetical protein [Oricola thermophila]QKV19740.1 hypothetical protein HTY61_15400 [Oricola thermophila]
MKRHSIATLVLLASSVALPKPANAQALVDVCTGLSVDLPVVQQITNAASGLLAGLLDPVLNAIIGDVNTEIVDTLSGRNIGLTVLDEDGNLVAPADDCNLAADSIVIDQDAGIALGGGTVSGLGGTSNTAASAGEVDSIAVGNGASTDPAAASAIALGLRGSVTATDGVAIGRDATATAASGVALGADSLADRTGMNGASEDFSGTAVGSTAGAVSVGSAGAERQITNVAGGTADTDAVNVRQLRAVGDDIAGALGGGAGFDATTGLFTGPDYTIRGTSYGDVGSALAALDTAIDSSSGIIAANNTGALPAATATGDDSLGVGYGASASGDDSVALGTGSGASGTGSTAVGNGATAAHAGATAIGAGATTTRANQMVLGTATTTYNMPGLGSTASRAAQSGPVEVVTTDSSGNLASVPLDSLISELSGMSETDLDALNRKIDDVRTSSRRGIAAAMAMANAPMPSEPGRTSWAANISVYEGEVASGFAVAHRLDTALPLGISGAIAVTADGVPGARAGMFGEF